MRLTCGGRQDGCPHLLRDEARYRNGCRCSRDGRYAPESDRLLRCREITLRAKSDQSASQQNCSYSITSSARAIRFGGTSRLNRLAVFLLMTSSNVVGN